MSRGYWCTLIAVVGWLALTGLAEGHGGGKGNYYKQQAASGQSTAPAKQLTPFQNPSDAVTIKAPCDTAVPDYDGDLCQQWRMAEAADRMVGVSIGQLILTVLSLLGLVFTVGYTRYYAKIAGEANDVTRKVGEAQVRAYLDITTAEVAIVSDPKRNDGKPSPNFVINFNNSGNSPARKFSWYFLVIYLWPKEKLLRGEKTFPPDNWTKDIAANKPLSINSHMLNGSLNDEENAIFGAKALHIIVTVVYRFIDVFDEPIIAEQNFAGHFASGTLGQFIELHRWPSSAEEMHIMFNKSKVAESTKPDQPNRQ